MLYELEHAGTIYRDANGNPGDAIALLRSEGVNLFRIRLFVDPPPSSEFNKVWGATQSLDQVRSLAKRIKASGAAFLLDLHYSDTWADPQKQTTPAAWKDLGFDDLKSKVHSYTAELLATLAKDGTLPNQVQIGNEITNGILWPTGKVLSAPANLKPQQWARFSALLNAGARAVREASTPDNPIRIQLHIHGGGKPGLPPWFFRELQNSPVDFDIAALSFYPAWGESLADLRKNMAETAELLHKPVVVAETSYPWREMRDLDSKYRPALAWPQTRDGQRQFIRDLTAELRAVPNNLGQGFIWWYPEAILTRENEGRFIWRGGAEALFDDEAKILPTLRP